MGDLIELDKKQKWRQYLLRQDSKAWGKQRNLKQKSPPVQMETVPQLADRVTRIATALVDLGRDFETLKNNHFKLLRLLKEHGMTS